MPSQELILNTAMFVAAGLVIALITMRLARLERKALFNKLLIMAAGVVGLVVLGEWSHVLGDMTILVVLRELALLLVAIGLVLVLLTFVFQGLLAVRTPRDIHDALAHLVGGG